MNILLICPKNKGNTFTVFSYIIEHAQKHENNIELYTLSESKSSKIDPIDLSDYDKIIFGSGVYGGKIHNALSVFLANIKREELKRTCQTYLFLTWFGRSTSNKDSYNQVSEILDDKGIILSNNTSDCFGSGFGIVRLGHPNTNELEDAVKWVNSL